MATLLGSDQPAGRPTGRRVDAPSEPSPLIQQALPDVNGKTFTSAIVDFPPDARAAPHRHGQAFVYAYVLEGTVAQPARRGKPRRTYHQGENWVEQPGAHHVLTENTSRTDPASCWSSSSPTPETSSRSTTRRSSAVDAG